VMKQILPVALDLHPFLSLFFLTSKQNPHKPCSWAHPQFRYQDPGPNTKLMSWKRHQTTKILPLQINNTMKTKHTQWARWCSTVFDINHNPVTWDPRLT
jgi:hypothetical protein